MFKEVSQVKEFILWARENKIKTFDGHGIKFELSEISYVEDLTAPAHSTPRVKISEEQIMDEQEKSILEENQQAIEKDDEDLFWSSGA